MDSSSSSLILGYWAIRGLAEPVRLLLEYLNISYKEEKYITVEDKERWLSTIKPNLDTPFPNLPYLIDNGKVITETDAILFYISCKANRKDLFGSSDEEILKLTQIRGVLKDFSRIISSLTYNPNFNEKLKNDTLENELFPYINKIIKFIGENYYLIGKEFKYVDLFFYENIEILQVLEPNLFNIFPALKKYWENFRKLNNIEKYLESGRFIARPFCNPLHTKSGI